MLTVEDVWKSGLPEGTELAGGASGLWHQVAWVARLLPRPPGFEGIKGGELALISTQSMKVLDERLTLTELMHRLGEKHVAGVAVLGEVSREAAAVADQHAIPLFSLPEGIHLPEVEQAITRLVVERRTELYQRGQEIFMQLTEIAIDGQGLPAILKKLAGITGKAVAIENEELDLEHLVASPASPVDAEEGRKLLDTTRPELSKWTRAISPGTYEPPTTKIEIPESDLVRLVAPISMKDRLWGYLSIIGAREMLSETDRLAVVRGASACAIEIARDRAVLDAQDRLQTDFVEDLLTGNFPSVEGITSRGKRLGHVLTPPYAVLAITALGKAGSEPGARYGEHDEGLLERLQRGIAGTSGYLYTSKDRTMFLLAPVDRPLDNTAMKKLGETIKNNLKAQMPNTDIAIGMGRIYVDLARIKLAYHEARQALGMGVRLFGKDCLVLFGELGIYRLLFSLHGTSDLQAFYDETLGTLVEYDRKNGAELLKTLQAYFASCNSLTDAADKLHLHRNTLLYRLHRIREIAGIDLDDPEIRLALQLALRIGETLQAG